MNTISKKINDFNVVEVSKTEAINISGGSMTGWLYNLGASVHSFICGLGDSSYDPGQGQEGLVYGSHGLKY